MTQDGTQGGTQADPDLAGTLAARIDAASFRRLGRSLAVFAVSAGGCGGCALEWAALRHVAAGLAGAGITVVDTPEAADVLLVSGAATRVLVGPLRHALACMGEPRWVVALGDCAIDGGVFATSGPVAGGVDAAVPVDVQLPGCPPAPAAILAALLAIVEANA